MCQTILIILWKDLLLRKNHYIITTMELALPISLIMLANILLPPFPVDIEEDPMSFAPFKDNHCVVKHGHYDSIVYTPSTPFTDLLMSQAGCYAGYQRSNLRPGSLSSNGSYYSVGVKFEGISDMESTIPKSLNYTLYPTHEIWLNMHSLWRHPGSLPRYTVPVLQNVVEFQRAIDVSYMHMNNITAKEIRLNNMDFFQRRPNIFLLSAYFCLFVGLSLMVPSIVSRVIRDKCSGAKELMLMVGVSRWQIWVAKFLDVMIFQTIVVTGIVIFLYVPLKEGANVLHISPFLFWGVLMYGMISLVHFLFFLSCCMNKPTLAVYLTEIIWMCSFLLNNVISAFIELPIFVRYLLCLFPHVAFMNGVSILLDYNIYDKTIKLTEKLSGKDDSLTLLSILIMLTVDTVLYAILTAYLDQVNPGKYGVAKHWNFFLKKSFWIPHKATTSKNGGDLNNIPANHPSPSVEPVPPNLPVGISIRNVSKVFKCSHKGVITAVDNVSLNFYQGEITGLLGHNGAGKSTLCSMITGLSTPTSGKIYINGFDLRARPKDARYSLGLCPQEDMLFDDLTTIQILKFYGVIKGLKLKQANIKAKLLIKRLKLESVINTQARKLSGGQKRKVSLAIALIGDSEVLILDEPTSGMDAEVRREIWELLLKYRHTKTILLMSHFMEEADALCDRIAIMDHGEIKCYGSPIFLKSKFGASYNLSVVVSDVDKIRTITDYLTELLGKLAIIVKIKAINVRNVTFELPDDCVTILPEVFSKLEEMQIENVITSFSINRLTLEDVFLRLIAHEDTDSLDSPAYQKLDMDIEDTSYKKSSYKSSKKFLFFHQFWVLIVKKWILFLRLHILFLCFVVIQTLILGAYLTYESETKNTDTHLHRGGVLTYSVHLYPSSLIYYTNSDKDNLKPIFEKFIRNSGSYVQEVQDIREAAYEMFQKDFYTYARKLNLAFHFFPHETLVLHNEDAVHVVPAALNLLDNLLFKLNNKSNSIVTNVDDRYATKDYMHRRTTSTSYSLNYLLDICGILAIFYLVAPIKETIHGAKEMQLMITPPFLYWLSSLVFDTILFIAYLYLAWLVVGLVFNDDYGIIIEHADEIFPSLLLWAIGLILVSYVITTLVKEITRGITLYSMFYVIFTFIVYSGVGFTILPKYLLYFHPNCILKHGYSTLAFGKNDCYMLSLFLYDIILFLFLILKDYNVISVFFHLCINKIMRVYYSPEKVKDEYVEKEKDLVINHLQDDTSNCVLIVDGLKRWYMKGLRPTPAVQGISFTVNKGECFGLLGVNGAGKTSTFKMLTGILLPSRGRIYIGSPLTKSTFCKRRKYLQSIGYCPQSGGLIHVFTGRELLKFFGQLRGVHWSYINGEVEKWLEKLNLVEYKNEKCSSYSGGNLRKLSTAISLIGNCPLIFLDEPTSGVDPVSRRSLWKVIGDVQKKGQSVVLTSHSMDECEALCSRLAIMVNGRFRCIGETTTLKDRFGRGYTVQLKISNSASVEQIKSLQSSFEKDLGPDCELVDVHLTMLEYRVSSKLHNWSYLFTVLNKLKTDFDTLESYTASATTLEQIFMYFARNQEKSDKRGKISI